MSFGMFLAGAASGAAQGYMMHKMANRKGGTAKPDGAMPEATPPAAGATTPPAATVGTAVANPAVSDQAAFNDTFNELTEQEGVVG